MESLLIRPWTLAIVAATLVLLVVSWRAARASDVEHARYQVLEEVTGFEVRQYFPSIELQTAIPSDSRSALSGGFRRLAGYIFGNNGTGEVIPMTAPVTSRATAAGWAMSFVMPSSYEFDELPSPKNGDIQLHSKPGQTVAALRFSGRATPRTTRTMEMRLLELLRGAGMEPSGPLVLAQYDPPTQLPFLRRNEILAPLAQPGELNSPHKVGGSSAAKDHSSCAQETKTLGSI